LKNANPVAAYAVILLLNEESQDPDADNIATLSALKYLIESENLNNKKPKPNIIIEVKMPRNKLLFKSLGAKALICKNFLGAGLLAQACSEPNIVEVYEDLLSFRDKGVEIYIIPLDIQKLSKKNILA